jgi:hypothetical protein
MMSNMASQNTGTKGGRLTMKTVYERFISDIDLPEGQFPVDIEIPGIIALIRRELLKGSFGDRAIKFILVVKHHEVDGKPISNPLYCRLGLSSANFIRTAPIYQRVSEMLSGNRDTVGPQRLLGPNIRRFAKAAPRIPAFAGMTM